MDRAYEHIVWRAKALTVKYHITNMLKITYSRQARCEAKGGKMQFWAPSDGTPSVTWRKRQMPQLMLSVLAAVLFSAATGSAAESMHAEIEKYEGTKTCLECHDTLGKEMAATLHYQLQGEPQLIEGWEKGKTAGLLTSFSPAANTVAGHNWLTLVQPSGKVKVPQPDGCGRCHAGLGAKPKQTADMADSDYENIDCLICHGPGYERTIEKQVIKQKGKVHRINEASYRLVPAPGIDILKVVRNVQKPTAEMCLRCHAMAAGGLNYQDGVVPTADTDVHLSMGMNCTECHTTKQHKIAGGGDLKGQEMGDMKVACDNCHTLTPHKGEKADYLNRHVARIACQTCHIPAIARDPKMPTLVESDWTKPVLDTKTGLFVPASKTANNIRPEYLWWNGTMQANGEPAGGKRDRKSKVYPWKRTRFTLIADSSNDKPVLIKSAVYAASGDVAAAAIKGMVEAKQTYSGEWKGVPDSTLSSVNHQVAPKSESLQCDVCHSEETILDFKALGMKSRRK